MRVTLPLPPNLANARFHWRTKDKKRKDYRMECFVWTIGRQLRPRTPFKRAKITATLYLYARMDWDNLMARMKWPQDFLVQDGWIESDSPDHLVWSELPAQAIDRKRPRVEITLEAL